MGTYCTCHVGSQGKLHLRQRELHVVVYLYLRHKSFSLRKRDVRPALKQQNNIFRLHTNTAF